MLTLDSAIMPSNNSIVIFVCFIDNSSFIQPEFSPNNFKTVLYKKDGSKCIKGR